MKAVDKYTRQALVTIALKNALKKSSIEVDRNGKKKEKVSKQNKG